jgi:hypothetical protein
MIKPVLHRLKINVGRIRFFGYFLQALKFERFICPCLIWTMWRWRTDIRTWADVGESTRDVGEMTVGETTRWRNDRNSLKVHTSGPQVTKSDHGWIQVTTDGPQVTKDGPQVITDGPEWPRMDHGWTTRDHRWTMNDYELQRLVSERKSGC